MTYTYYTNNEFIKYLFKYLIISILSITRVLILFYSSSLYAQNSWWIFWAPLALPSFVPLPKYLLDALLYAESLREFLKLTRAHREGKGRRVMEPAFGAFWLELHEMSREMHLAALFERSEFAALFLLIWIEVLKKCKQQEE